MSVFTLGNYTVHLGTGLLGFQLPEGLKIISSCTLQTYLFILYNSDADSCDIINGGNASYTINQNQIFVEIAFPDEFQYILHPDFEGQSNHLGGIE